MNFPELSPLKFYLRGHPTYNEKDEPGVEKKQFLQSWNNEDIVRLQFLGRDNINYQLQVRNINDEILATRHFHVSLIHGIFFFNLEFRWADLGIFDDVVRCVLTATHSMSAHIANQNQIVFGTIATIGGRMLSANIANQNQSVSGLIAVLSGNNRVLSANIQNQNQSVSGAVRTIPYEILVQCSGFDGGTTSWDFQFFNSIQSIPGAISASSPAIVSQNLVLRSDGTISFRFRKTSNGGVVRGSAAVDAVGVINNNISWNDGDNAGAWTEWLNVVAPGTNLTVNIIERGSPPPVGP